MLKRIGTIKYNSRNQAFSSILAIWLMIIFTVLALAFSRMVAMNVKMSKNHADYSSALAAAESGLQWSHFLINDYLDQSSAKAYQNNLSETECETLFEGLYYHAVTNGNVSATVSDNGNNKICKLSPIAFPSDTSQQFSITINQINSTVLEIVSVGQSNDITRSVSLSYNMERDTSMLDFAIASRSPIVIKDNTTIKKGIYSSYANPSPYPLSLGSFAQVQGDINTVLSEADFEDAEYDLKDLLQGEYSNLLYNQPEIDLPSANDFDTSDYADIADNKLPRAIDNNQKEYYPHAPGDYEASIDGSSQIMRKVYGVDTSANLPDDQKVVITNATAQSNNALFKNCIFEGVLFIGTQHGLGTNNIRFENCTFNGMIVTGVPPKFGIEDWKKNALYFTGTSKFNGTEMNQNTIIAPNYNVDLGDVDANSTFNGIVIGGVVDIRGDATINGSIISMADPAELKEDIGNEADVFDTTIGTSDDGSHTIVIDPPENAQLPDGIATKIVINRNPGTYLEN